jgi:hypothetical protein
MSFDLGTLSGVLGVVLTIVFFFIGYRGTIGARKERATSTNREIVDTLLRRFTLDTSFSLQYDEIERFVAGKALSNRVKLTDVFSMEEIFSLLYSQVISSDYVGPKIRKTVLEKLNKCFKSPSEKPFTYESTPIQPPDKVRSYIEVLLGVGSALLGAAASVATAFVATKGLFEGVSFTSFRWELLIALGVSALTALALVLFSRLRDRTTATKPDEFFSILPRPREFEARVIERLRAIDIPFSQQRDLDLVISFKDKKVGIELKVFPPPPTKLVSIARQMETLLPKYGCEEGIIVIASPVPNQVRGMSLGKIRLLTLDDFFKLLTVPEPLRGAS